MTRYTVSPPMLIEKSQWKEPLLKNYTYDIQDDDSVAFGEAVERCGRDWQAYDKHVKSLQQIRMSEELVKWCEENKKVEIDEGEFEVKEGIISQHPCSCACHHSAIMHFVPCCENGYLVERGQIAFPVEVVDEVEDLFNLFYTEHDNEIGDWHKRGRLLLEFRDWMKKQSKYKLTKL